MSTATGKLDDLTLSAYRHVIECSRWDGAWLSEVTGAPMERIDEVHQTLSDLRLIERESERGSNWRAVSPRVAMAELVAPIETEVRRRASYAENLREQLQMFLPIHEAKQQSDARYAVEAIPDEAALDTFVEEETAKVRTELVVMLANADTPALTVDRYHRGRARGVQVRTVFQHSARYDAGTDEFMGTLNRTGTEFRTLDELPIHMMIFDRATCVIWAEDAGEPGSDADETGVAVAIRHPLVVSTMAWIFERAWTQATPYQSGDPLPASVEDELRRSILRLLATGAKDEFVARRLGISVRTCRRHISTIMRDLGATSRFQGGAAAQRERLL